MSKAWSLVKSISGLCCIVAGVIYGSVGYAQTQQVSTVDQYRTTLDRYCVTCHNDTLKTANIILDKADLNDLGKNPELWEKLITKLSLRQMPPVGMPRPDESFYTSFIDYLSNGMDSLAKAANDPGNNIFAHRLNRAEYTNAIRDLLKVEIDGASLLPPDHSGGFDNLGDLLSVSQVLMESYISVARTVSRMAVGDTSIPVDSLQYTIDPTLLQNARMNEDLPFGTRGGLAVRHHFPLDGEYVLNVRLQRSANQFVVGIDEPRRLDVRVDGERVKLFTVGGDNVGLAYAAGRADKLPPDPEQSIYERSADDVLEVRFPMKAGTRNIQVAFLEDIFAWEAPVPEPSYDSWYESRLVDEYARAWAEPLVSNIVVTGPYNATGKGETESRQRIFVCMPSNTAEEEPCARKILSNLARLAFRRPVDASSVEIDMLLGLYSQARSKGSFEDGIQMAIEVLLVSTEFLFRIADDPAKVVSGEVFPISNLELASRLSFFLWSSIPDDELLTVAEQGKLREPAVLEQQVKRMLDDERSKSLVSNFADQWLLLRNLSHMNKTQDIFLEFDESLRQDMATEIELFIGSIFRENRSILDLLRADYSYLNERMARHYEIEGIKGSRFQKVTIDDPNKRGLLSRAAVLSITTYPNRNSTVLRGKWVLENILAAPPPPPPVDIPALEEVDSTRPGEILTLRQKMEIHPANPTCAVCHNQFDPIGFALENFNAIGQWRTEDEGKPINAKSKLPSGIEFEGPAELQQALLSDPELIAKAFTQKLLIYALGRPLEYYDMPTVRQIVKDATEDEYSLSSIVLGIVNSSTFNMRRAGT